MHSRIGITTDTVKDIVGSSGFARDLRDRVRSISGETAHVVISSESGAGKRFLASVIHGATFPSRGSSFVEMTPRTHEDEVRAILFGEDVRRVEGMLGRKVPELGDQGTLFIRNVHEFSIIGQTRIARFLIQSESGVANGKKWIRVIFAAPERSTTTRSRSVIDSLDKYLQKFTRIVLPPLRARQEDIPALVDFFLRTLLPHKTSLVVENDVMERMTRHAWYDNVRELKMVVEQGIQNSANGVFVLPESFVDEIALVTEMLTQLLDGKKSNLDALLTELEVAFLRRALVRTEFDRLKSAHLLGVSDLNMLYRLKKFRSQLLPLRNNGNSSKEPAG